MQVRLPSYSRTGVRPASKSQVDLPRSSAEGKMHTSSLGMQLQILFQLLAPNFSDKLTTGKHVTVHVLKGCIEIYWSDVFDYRKVFLHIGVKGFLRVRTHSIAY